MLPEDGGPSPQQQQPPPRVQSYVLEHVLRGDFPAASIRKMNKTRLERLVTQLIQRTTNNNNGPALKRSTTKSKKQQQQHSPDTNGVNTSTASTADDKKAVVTLKKPKWWPSDVTFNHTLGLGGSENNCHEVRVLKQLVADCSQFCKNHNNNNNNNNKVRKWPQPETHNNERQHRPKFWEENDENARRTTSNNNKLKLKPPSGLEKPVKQKPKQPSSAPRKPYKAFVEIRPSSVEPFGDDCPQVPPPPSPSLEPCPTLDENQFLAYFKLTGNNNNNDTPESTNKKCTTVYDNNNSASSTLVPCYHSHPMKLTNTFNIPFSSDVGRIMASRENHFMPEDLKLRRLERSEWYTNKIAADKDKVPFQSQNTGADFDFGTPSNFKEPPYTRTYKPPKRQYHQKRWSLHNVKFLAKFCTPVSVRIERQDFSKLVVIRTEPPGLKMDDQKTVSVNLEQMDLSKYKNKNSCRRPESATVKVVLQRMHLNKNLVSSGSKKIAGPKSVLKSNVKFIGNVQKTRKKILNPSVDLEKGCKDKSSSVRTSPRLKCKT